MAISCKGQRAKGIAGRLQLVSPQVKKKKKKQKKKGEPVL